MAFSESSVSPTFRISFVASRCPVELIGRNSVRPSTIPKMAAFQIDSDSSGNTLSNPSAGSAIKNDNPIATNASVITLLMLFCFEGADSISLLILGS